MSKPTLTKDPEEKRSQRERRLNLAGRRQTFRAAKQIAEAQSSRGNDFHRRVPGQTRQITERSSS
jgi:hypothetical protein